MFQKVASGSGSSLSECHGSSSPEEKRSRRKSRGAQVENENTTPKVWSGSSPLAIRVALRHNLRWWWRTAGRRRASEQSPSDVSQEAAVSEVRDVHLRVEQRGDGEGLPLAGLEERRGERRHWTGPIGFTPPPLHSLVDKNLCRFNSVKYCQPFCLAFVVICIFYFFLFLLLFFSILLSCFLLYNRKPINT